MQLAPSSFALPGTALALFTCHNTRWNHNPLQNHDVPTHPLVTSGQQGDARLKIQKARLVQALSAEWCKREQRTL
jgi:hypothetical protein